MQRDYTLDRSAAANIRRLAGVVTALAVHPPYRFMAIKWRVPGFPKFVPAAPFTNFGKPRHS
jgi:hypothetical protein